MLARGEFPACHRTCTFGL